VLQEQDDDSDEGDPESGAQGRGEAEKMSQFEIRSKLRRNLTLLRKPRSLVIALANSSLSLSAE
jgi:hypothetical protein